MLQGQGLPEARPSPPYGSGLGLGTWCTPSHGITVSGFMAVHSWPEMKGCFLEGLPKAPFMPSFLVTHSSCPGRCCWAAVALSLALSPYSRHHAGQGQLRKETLAALEGVICLNLREAAVACRLMGPPR